MFTRLSQIAVVIGAMVVLSTPVAGHHSIASEFDFNKEMNLEGTLHRMDWIAPHPILHLQVANPDGTKVVWLFQSANSLLGTGATSQLRRAPSQGGLEIGKTYTFTGFQARNGKTMAFLKAVKMPDGRVVTAWFGDPNA